MPIYKNKTRHGGIISLYKILIRYIAKNIETFKDCDYLKLYPFLIKENLINQVVHVNNGFHDDDLLNLLLHEKITSILLSTSTITNKTLNNICMKCTNLVEVKLSNGTYKFTKQGFIENIPLLTSLVSLQVSDCNEIDNEVISAIANRCKNLDFLDISKCSKVTDEAINCLKNLKLSKLNISRTEITDRSLLYLGTGVCSKYLIDLNVSYCNISNAGMKQLNWNVIKFIGFQGCPIDDLDFIKMNGNLKFLQWSV